MHESRYIFWQWQELEEKLSLTLHGAWKPYVKVQMGLSADKTQDKSHLGVRDLCTGCYNSKDLINCDKTGLDPILLPVLNLRVLDIIDL